MRAFAKIAIIGCRIPVRRASASKEIGVVRLDTMRVDLR